MQTKLKELSEELEKALETEIDPTSKLGKLYGLVKDLVDALLAKK